MTKPSAYLECSIAANKVLFVFLMVNSWFLALHMRMRAHDALEDAWFYWTAMLFFWVLTCVIYCLWGVAETCLRRKLDSKTDEVDD